MKKLILTGSIFFLVCFVIFILVHIRHGKAFVSIQNNGNNEMTDVEILMAFQESGQGIFVGRCVKGEKRTVKLPLKGECSVRLAYKNSLNQQHQGNEMYVEGNGGYHISFKVTESEINAERVFEWILPLW